MEGCWLIRGLIDKMDKNVKKLDYEQEREIEKKRKQCEGMFRGR